MVKTVAGVTASLAFTAFVWYWAASHFTDYQAKTNRHFAYVQRHQGDGLHALICYFEYRTIRAKTLSPAQRANGVRTLEVALRKARLPGCTKDDLRQ